MRVLVDTPVWSLALRRQSRDLSREEHKLTQTLADLISEGRAEIIGPVRQELLSGIREADRFAKLRQYLRAFEEPGLNWEDYEEAARMNNQCRARGVAGSAIDFLICAVSTRREWAILTTDQDFLHYSKVLPIKLCNHG